MIVLKQLEYIGIALKWLKVKYYILVWCLSKYRLILKSRKYTNFN